MLEKKKKIVVIGNGMVGFRFCEKLLEYDAFHEHQITVLGDELSPAYDRVSLSLLFDGKTESDLVFAESRWYEYCKINLRLGARVIEINRSAQTVTTSSGKSFPYDHLVIATGARPHLPDISGIDQEGVHVYRTTGDATSILNGSRAASHAVVIGGGLLGLEVAEACREKGLETTIVEQESILMACQLDEAAGRLLDMKIENLGLRLRLNARVQSLGGSGVVESVRFENGPPIPADMVIIATGIVPNDELARGAGLELGTHGGIAIDEHTLTSDPHIFAIGDCAAFNNSTFGLVAPGYAMAEVAAAQLGKINKTFTMATPASKLKLLDLQVASIGQIHLEAPEARQLIDQEPARGVYKKLIMSNDLKRLLGAILVGETSEFERLRKHVEQKLELPSNPRALLAPIGEPLATQLDMEDDDVVCFCNYVTYGDICRAIDEKNLKSTSDVMGATYAAGLCGSCLDVLDAVTKAYLARK
ncbi:Nitrite reductase [NAD(P)H] [Pontiella desulfatans]|uniref:Nitrite reductase [NAD(P)H] n=1 Tax=Pontiella desulfatans TaxID=2750659 RepID=A0A6C2TZQ9_PONDE|nr:FAD-dependent oxidoreductase [Pontiella desulfatans]VGO12841.1 Nitrite reductase [NAD(P)H] [Pontiella desulfatans]